MSSFLKLISGRLLTYFGGLLLVLGAVGAYAGYRSLLITLPIIAIGLLLIIVGLKIRY